MGDDFHADGFFFVSTHVPARGGHPCFCNSLSNASRFQHTCPREAGTASCQFRQSQGLKCPDSLTVKQKVEREYSMTD